jgi:hypothetical protein
MGKVMSTITAAALLVLGGCSADPAEPPGPAPAGGPGEKELPGFDPTPFYAGSNEIDVTDTGNVIVDLTAEGTLDWVKWGVSSETSVDRKGGVPKLFSDFITIGKPDLHQYTDNHITFVWSDGTPNKTMPGTTSGVFNLGAGNGFALHAPADPTPRVLRVYVSGFGEDYRFDAMLSDGSAPDYTDITINNGTTDRIYKKYTFVYRSEQPNALLVVHWTGIKDHYGGANVTLQAATLGTQ